MLAGFIGSKKIEATCVKCGKRFDPTKNIVLVREDCEKNIAPNDVMYEEVLEKKYTVEEVEKKMKISERLLEKGLITVCRRIPNKKR